MRNSDAIDVICQHNRDGSIIPIKIRVQDDENMNNVYTIKSYTEVSMEKVMLPNEAVVTSDILRYDCEIVVFGTVKKVRLHYNKSRVKWYIYV